MTPLVSLAQLQLGTRLKIVGKHPSDNYGAISVKKIITCTLPCSNEAWHEILINRTKNYYFHFENYLAGKSLWVKEVYVLEGLDKRVRP